MENKKERFKRIASKRMQKTLNELDKLINCSNTNNYEYDSVDVEKMIKALNEKMSKLKTSFRAGKQKNNTFNF